MAYSIEDIEKMMGKSSNKAAVEKARQGEWHGFGVNDPDEGDWSEFGEKSPALLAPTNSINTQLSQQQLGRSGNTAFKEYVARVQQAIDKAPEAQPQWLQNKKTQAPIFSTVQYGQQHQNTARDAWKGFGVNDPSKGDWSEWGKNAPANLVDLIKMQYDNPPNRTGFAAGSVAGASAPPNDELVAFRAELSNSPDIAMRYRWANASDEDVAAELQRRKQAELQNQEYQRLMEENAKNMTLDDYIDPSYRLNDFDKTRAQEIIDAFYEKYPKDGKWYNGDYSPNTRKAMYNDPDMQKIVILENKLNPVASLVYGAKNALPIDPFGKTYENAVEKLYDAVGADQSAYDTLHNTMEGTRSASSNAQTQNPVAYLGGYMGTNLGLYKGGKDIMLGLPGIGKGLKAAGGAISNAASKVPVVGSTLGRVLTADRVAGFLGDSALDLALDTIPNEVVTGFEEGEGAAQIAKDAAGNMAQNALFNVAGEVVPATIKGTSNLITRGQMNRIADALDDGAKLTAEQISEYNRLAAKVGEIGSEDWLNVNMAKYADEMPVKNAAQPIATGTEASIPSMADIFPLSNKTPVQSETDALVNAFYNNTLTNAQIETLKPGGKNRAAFEAATGLPLPETASKTRALLKLGAEESIDGTLKTEYNGVNRGVQNGTANPAGASVASGEGIPLKQQGFGSDSNVASGRQYTGGNRGTVSVLNNNVNGGVQNEPTGAERVSGVFENTMPVGPGMGSGHGQPGELAGGNQVLYRVLNNDRTTSDALTRVGSAYTDLHDTTAQPQVFTAALDDAIKANKHGLMVSSKTPQELADSGAVTFMTNDGLAGAAVTADGDIEAVFKNPASQIKRASAPLMLNAIENGGRKLDCYGIDLVQNYNKFGFEPVARVAWNPEYAPDGWTYGPKDVYVMKLADGLDADGVKARLGFSESDGGFHKWTQPELDALPEMDYDEALAYRDSLLEQGAKPVAESASELYGQNTVGAAERNEHSFSALQNTYGTIEPGENPARVVDVPKSTNGKDKVRQFTRTAMEAKATTDELIPLFEQNVEDGLFSYNAKKDKPALDAAVRTITDKGWDGALAQWRDVVEGRTPAGKGNITLGQLLYAEAAKAGDTELAMQLAAEVAAEGTRAGQTVQALRLLKKMTPEGQLYYVNRVVDNLNRDIKAGNRTGIGVNWKTKRAIQSGEKTVEIPNYLAEQLLNAKTESEITDASTAIMKNVADQLPADWATKWNSWRYLAMLGNVRTHIRNIAGNAVFWPARQIKNMTGSWLEQLFVREPAKRTKAILNPFNDADKSRMVFAKNDFDQSMKTVVQGTGKLNPESVIRQNQTVFTSKAMKPIETLRKANSAALEWEDTVFSKNAYVDSMAGFMKARGLTEADMTGRTLEQARTYAINQAQKATYRDASALAKKISDLANTNAATRLVVGGTMPFTTTPINIAKRGIEYSPAGIAKAITYDLYQLQKGNMTATDVVEDLASGLTGTGIVALGAALASMGFLTGGGEDNKKEEQFKDMQGVQNYALQIGDSSYTIDWLAPISLPLFVGVETWNAFQEDGEFSLARVLDTMTSITEPMMNLTLLQGINSAIKTAGYSDNPVPDIMLNAAVGYAGQAVPTLAGQIARSIDDTRRATFTQTGAPLAQQDKSLQKIKNKIPFLSQTSQPYVDQWGRTQENTGGSFAGRLAYNMLSPGYYSKNKPTQVDNWLQQLYDRTGESSVLPSYAQKNFTKDGIKHNLTAEQYTAYAKERGQTAYDILEVLVPGYKDLTDQQAVHATEKAYKVATEFAKQEALGIEPSKEVQNNIERAEKWGDGDWMAGIADILKANALTYTVKGDLIPGTKDKYYDGSRKRNCISALVDAGYSQYQALQLYDLLNG